MRALPYRRRSVFSPAGNGPHCESIGESGHTAFSGEALMQTGGPSPGLPRGPRANEIAAPSVGHRRLGPCAPFNPLCVRAPRPTANSRQLISRVPALRTGEAVY